MLNASTSTRLNSRASEYRYRSNIAAPAESETEWLDAPDAIDRRSAEKLFDERQRKDGHRQRVEQNEALRRAECRKAGKNHQLRQHADDEQRGCNADQRLQTKRQGPWFLRFRTQKHEQEEIPASVTKKISEQAAGEENLFLGQRKTKTGQSPDSRQYDGNKQRAIGQIGVPVRCEIDCEKRINATRQTIAPDRNEFAARIQTSNLRRMQGIIRLARNEPSRNNGDRYCAPLPVSTTPTVSNRITMSRNSV
jgi:hypothetical protein